MGEPLYIATHRETGERSSPRALTSEQMAKLGGTFTFEPAEPAQAPPAASVNLGGQMPTAGKVAQMAGDEDVQQGAIDSLKQSGNAFVRGWGNPTGHADEIQAFVQTMGTDRPFEEARRNAEIEEREIERKNPTEYGTGRAVAPALAGALVGVPASAAGRVALGTAEGAAWGGATGHGEAQPGERTEGAIEGGKQGAKVGGGLAAGLAGFAALANTLGRQANKMRGSATGMYSGQAERLAKEEGKEFIGEMGAALERYGADQRGNIPGLKSLPMGAAAYAKRLEEVVSGVGKQIAEVLEEATRAGISVPADRIRNRIIERAVRLEAKTTDSARAQADKLYEIASRIDEGPEAYTASELQALKQDWTDEVWKSGDVAKPRGGNVAEAYRAGAGVPREMLDEAISAGMSPEQAAKFKALRKDYGFLRTAQDLAEGREFRETGNQLLSLPTTVMGAGGVATRDPAIALGSMAAQAATKKYGKDVAADILRTGEKASRLGGRVSPIAGGIAGGQAPKSASDMVQQLAETNPQRLGQFGPQLAAAAQDPDRFFVTHSILMQTDPQYQQLLRELEDEESPAEDAAEGGEENE